MLKGPSGERPSHNLFLIKCLIFHLYIHYPLLLDCQNFSENPYFEDSKLIKSYAFADDGTTTINATSIKWKEGMVSRSL